MIIEQQIEEILIEASAYGLRIEVMNSAKELIKEGYDELTAYQLGYDEWIK